MIVCLVTQACALQCDFTHTNSHVQLAALSHVAHLHAASRVPAIPVWSACRSDQFIELELPPDFGNGAWNAGIPLARLLWHVPVQGLMTLLAALLLERRVILVAKESGTVSAAVHAAAALLYPFRWQHIYLPLLPDALKVSTYLHIQVKECSIRKSTFDFVACLVWACNQNTTASLYAAVSCILMLILTSILKCSALSLYIQQAFVCCTASL